MEITNDIQLKGTAWNKAISDLGVSSEALMLSSKDFCSISNGSACNSKSYSPSYVLLAMGIPKDQIESSVRISWGHDITIDEIEKSFQNVIEAAKGLVW